MSGQSDYRRRSGPGPGAMAGSALLHGAVIASAYVAFLFAAPPRSVEVTPINLVARGPAANAPAAEEAPHEQHASAEEIADKPSPPPAPKAEPTPEPPKPTPAPVPTPKPPKPAPPKPRTAELSLDKLAQSAPHPAKSQNLNLDQIAKSSPRTLDLASLASTGAEKARAARRGPAQSETAEIARKAVGNATTLSADERAYLAAKLIKLWNPNCGVEDAANVVVRVNIRLSPEGRVLAVRDLTGHENAIVQAAAVRALTAVKEAEPYDGLPHETYANWREVNCNFIAKDACRR